MPPRRAAVTFIFFTAVLDMLAFGIIIPVLPKLVEQFMGGDPVRGARIYGLFGASWSLMQVLFSPLQGAISDRYGRRPVILISCFGLGIDYFLMALAPSVGWLLLGRVISGITSASFSVAGAYIADVTPPEKRAAAFGMIGAAFGIGFVGGPAIGGFMADIDPRAPFWFAGALALLNASYGLFVLPESLPPERRMPRFLWSRANPIGALRLLRSHHSLLGLAGINFLFQTAHYVLPSTCVLYASYRYAWSGKMLGTMMALTGVCSILVQALLVKPIVARLRERGTLLTGLAFAAVGFAGFGSSTTGTGFLLWVPIFALSGLVGPGLQALMSQRVGPQEQGQLQGANMCLAGMAGLFAPLLFTQTFAWFISPAAPFALPGSPFLLAASVVALALLLATYVGRPEQTVADGA